MYIQVIKFDSWVLYGLKGNRLRIDCSETINMKIFQCKSERQHWQTVSFYTHGVVGL